MAGLGKGTGTGGRTNARGQRRSHAARLTTRPAARARPAGDGKRPRGIEVRERMLHAALECFGAFGYEGTSTRAVAERAGFSHSLLLYHFESKDALWRSTMEDVLGRYRLELQARLARVAGEDAAAGLRAFIENFVLFSSRVPQLHRIMTQESTQGSERIHWLIKTHLRESFVRVCTLVRQAQAAGAVRAGDPSRLYYAVVGVAGTLLSVATEYRELTGLDVFAPGEIRRTIEFTAAFLFAPAAAGDASVRS